MLITNTVRPKAKYTSNVLSHQAEWALVDALNGGTPMMRAAGRTYLPQDVKEYNERYETRLQRSVLDNFYSEAVDRGVDKIFTQDIRLIDQPGELKIFWNDVDAQGRDGTQFAKEVMKKAIDHGVSYILTDYTALPEGGFQNRAQELAAGGRPYWVSISAPQVVQLMSEIVGGQECLAVFKWETQVTYQDVAGDWHTTQEVRTFTRTSVDGLPGPVEFMIERMIEGVWELIDQGNLPSTILEIPVRAVYANRDGFMMGSPVFLSLAELNVQHYQKRSDIENILHIVNVPFLFGKGFDKPTADTANGRPIGNKVPMPGDDKPALEIDVHNAILSSKDTADIKWVEHTGAAVSIALDDIKRLEARMKELGSSLFTSAGGDASATEKAINAAEANARLKSMALALQDCLELCIVDLVRYMGITLPTSAKLEVNTTFSMDFVSDSTFPAVVSLFRAGLIGRDTVMAEAKRRNIIGLDVPTEPPASPAQVLPPESMSADETVTETGTVTSTSVI